MEKDKKYESITIDGVSHNVAAVKSELVGDDYKVKFMLMSFYTRQQHDQFLASIQKGEIFWIGEDRYFTNARSYVSAVKKCKDDNKGDGYHSMIYSDLENVIRVYPNENVIDKVFDYIDNKKTGLIKEWKTYFYNELKDRGNIVECEGFDFTGYAPKVYVLNNIDDELLKNIKAYGLKSGEIILPVNFVQTINPNESYIGMLSNYIIPNISEEKCWYNIGEKISEYIKSKIINPKTGKEMKAFPKQQIIGQGVLNFLKEKENNSAIVNGGMGLGKTFITAKLILALYKEYFKKEHSRVVLYCEEKLMEKWIRELNWCLNPLGVYPTYIKVARNKDVDKVTRKPQNGLEIILLPRDTVKRMYLKECLGTDKFYNTSKIRTELCTFGIDENAPIEIRKCNLKLSEMKVTAMKYERMAQKKVVLYTEVLNDLGNIEKLRCVTSSKVLKKATNTTNKAYDFEVSTLEELQSIISANIGLIVQEKVLDKSETSRRNRLVCPHCGGEIYYNSEYMFDWEKVDKYYTVAPSKSQNISLCNHYVKADGTTLTEIEKERIRKGHIKYEVVDHYTKYPYINEVGETLTGVNVQKAKRNLIPHILLLKKCGKPMFGAKIQKGYRVISTVEKLAKKLGKKSVFDIAVFDECHQLSRQSLQGQAMATLCKMSKKRILLSGTICNGKASSLYYMLWRLDPRKMVAAGYKFSDENLFVQHYGRLKRVTKEVEDRSYGSNGNTRMQTGQWTEIAGISPLLYNNHFSGIMVSRTIADLKIPMPKLKFIKHELEMPSDVASGYDKLKSDMVRFMKENKGVGLGGSYISSLVSYPNNPMQDDIVLSTGDFVARPTYIDLEDRLLPKEEKLIETCKLEIAQGRRVLVYACFTGKKAVTKRIVEFLSPHFKVAEMKGNGAGKVAVADREKWIQEQYQKGTEIIVCNPTLVETGLNIVEYPSIYYYEVPLKVDTLLQSECRAYRPHQTKECRVYYSYYVDSLQEDVMKLVGGKKKATNSFQGLISEDMLSMMGDDGDTITGILNKILEGKINLKEDNLDGFGFEDEIDYSFVENEEGNIDVTRTTQSTVEMTVEQVKKISTLSVFEIDEEFFKSKKAKKKTAPTIGQYGFNLDSLM